MVTCLRTCSFCVVYLPFFLPPQQSSPIHKYPVAQVIFSHLPLFSNPLICYISHQQETLHRSFVGTCWTKNNHLFCESAFNLEVRVPESDTSSPNSTGRTKNLTPVNPPIITQFQIDSSNSSWLKDRSRHHSYPSSLSSKSIQEIKVGVEVIVGSRQSSDLRTRTRPPSYLYPT